MLSIIFALYSISPVLIFSACLIRASDINCFVVCLFLYKCAPVLMPMDNKFNHILISLI
uniref:Uncharacterized protein n=1 Tax=uncultured marine virus TaxID=186617 RepID=A0A0F7L9D6_9VIRU|nr:hypothetical protein [uncultured marine virus]